MYRELIAEFSRDSRSARRQEPCSEAELQEAEAYVGYAFPEELKELLRETNGDRFLLLSAAEMMEVVRCNREILAEGFDDAEEFSEKVDRHIFFAANGCGDYYCYRVLPDGRTDTSAIYIWEHEICGHRVVAKDIPDLIRRYYSDEI